MSTPFLNDAFVRSALTRKIAALETSTRRSPSQSQVNQLSNLTRAYHGILATPNMQPDAALGVLSKIAPPSPKQLSRKRDDEKDASLALQIAMEKQQHQMQTLSNMMKTMHDTSSSIIQNLK